MIELKFSLLFAIICNTNQLLLPSDPSEIRYEHISDIEIYGINNHIALKCGDGNIEDKIFSNSGDYLITQNGKERYAKADVFHISFYKFKEPKCRFPTIPNNFKFDLFKNLETVELSDIQLGTYEMNPFWNEKRVKKLIASNNRLTEISPKYFPISDQIEELDLYKNAIQRIDPLAFKTAKSIKKVKLSNNRISEIEENCFSVPSLVELDISRNILQTVHEHAFKGAINLYVLDLSYNSIYSLKAGTFAGLTKLEYLKLKGAGILRIESGTFSQQPKLHNLDLSENRLVNLDFSQVKLPNVDHIDLSHNNLTELRGFRRAIIPKLLQMNLLGNDFNCSYLINLMGVRWRAFRLGFEDPFFDPTKEMGNKGHVNGVLCEITPINDEGTKKNESNPTPTHQTFSMQQSANELKYDVSFIKFSILTIFLFTVFFFCIKSCLCRNGRFNFGRFRQEMDFPGNVTALPGQYFSYSNTERK